MTFSSCAVMLNVVMLIVIMLNVIMLNVIMLSVVAPSPIRYHPSPRLLNIVSLSLHNVYI